MNRANMDYTGFIDKRHNQKEFVEAISSCDLGCLFSSTEALGISTLEFLRVGVPVAGFYHQGLKDTLMEGASLRFAPTSSAIEIADGIEGLIRNNDYQEMLKQMACRYSEQVTWDQCIVHFQNLLYGS